MRDSNYCSDSQRYERPSVVNIIGGLGNQLFQYAFGANLSSLVGQQVLYSVDAFDSYDLHNGLELENVFDICLPRASKEDLHQLLGGFNGYNLRRLGEKLANYRVRLHRRCLYECDFNGWDDRRLTKRYYFHGYWQSEEYFFKVTGNLRHDLRFRLRPSTKDSVILDRFGSENSVGIHVRRGDYLSKKNLGKFALLGRDYYDRAINCVLQRVENPRFYIFSDEPREAAELLKDSLPTAILVDHNSGTHSSRDLMLMASVKHNIIANSSFSWWAAWLNSNNSKVVVAPNRWFTYPQPGPSIIPNGWLRV
jgi:hypothetical protein